MEIVRKFQEAIETARKVEADALAEGGAGSWEEYRYRVGVRKGLMKALRIFEDVLEDVAKSEEASFLRRDT
jgi:hypothetical protein